MITRESALFLSNLNLLSFKIQQKISLIIEIIVIIGFEIKSKHEKEKTYRKNFLNERGIKQENKRIGQLLSILVPDFVKESLIQGIQNVSENHENVTILFCDICDFDKLIKSEQQGIVSLLDELYRKFDILCLENQVQKIEVLN